MCRGTRILQGKNKLQFLQLYFKVILENNCYALYNLFFIALLFQSNGVELGRLALYFALQQEGPHTHLVGVNTTTLLDENLQVLTEGLTRKENIVLDYIQNKYVKCCIVNERLDKTQIVFSLAYFNIKDVIKKVNK